MCLGFLLAGSWDYRLKLVGFRVSGFGFRV